MTVEKAICFITEQVDLTETQKIELNKLPNIWWQKCASAILLARRKGYRIEVNVEGLLSGKLETSFILGDNYTIFHDTQTVQHNRSLKIKI